MDTKERQMEIYHLLHKLAETSHCIDKQVACIITDHDYNIISSGINTIVFCNKNCSDKENRVCNVVHAEAVARVRLPAAYRHGANLIAHVNLFPCQDCQQILEPHCDTIISYTEDHKGQIFPNIIFERNLLQELEDHNSFEKQLSVAQGELCELVTAISDYFYRPEKLMPMEELLDEIVDAELMIDLIKKICWEENHEAYNYLREIRSKKFLSLLVRLKNKTI